MDNKIYKSANGQEIDIQKLILKNETVRAVGNMNVNGRGDVVDNANKTTASRSSQVNKAYRKQIGNVSQDLPVGTSKADAERLAEEYVPPSSDLQVVQEDTITGLDETPVITTKTVIAEEVVEEVEEATGGLAAAIAKAREIKQESSDDDTNI